MIAPVLAAGVAVAGARPLSAISQAIQGLYGVAKELNEFLDKHIEEMKNSQTPTVSRTGRILEAAKFGFGVGYVTPIAAIAVGQLLLGNPLAAAGSVFTTATNPIAMTCAAMGAIYYGWGALTDQEREEILERVGRGLEVGVEFIRAVIAFIITKIKEWLSPENLAEIRRYITKAASEFGRTLGDVTGKVSDYAVDFFRLFKGKTGEMVAKTGEVVLGSYEAASGTLMEGVEMVAMKFSTKKIGPGVPPDTRTMVKETFAVGRQARKPTPDAESVRGAGSRKDTSTRPKSTSSKTKSPRASKK
jgi:hypothetical protein